MFIELTLSNGNKSLFNKNHIVQVWNVNKDTDEAAMETLIHRESEFIFLKDSYEEVKELLTK